MPCYLVERARPVALEIPMDEEGERIGHRVIATSGDDLLTWVQTYVTDDKARTFPNADAPSLEAIRHVARRNNPRVDKIVGVTALDSLQLSLARIERN